MMKISAFRNGKTLKKASMGNLKSLTSRGGMVWIDVERGTRKEFHELAKLFKLHPLTIEDMMKINGLPKIDVIDDSYMLLVFHEVFYDRHVKKIKMNEIDFCVGKNFIITVHLASIDGIESVRRKLSSGIYSSVTPDQIMYSIMDVEVEGYMKLMNQLDEEIENLEDKLLRNKMSHALHILSDHRREVTELRKIIGPQRDILNKLSRGEAPMVSQKMLFYFRDIYDGVIRFYSSLEAHRDAITSAFETYTSIQSNNINKVLKQLSIISTVFLPLSFLAGVYGMNFVHMPGLDYTNSFPLMVAVFAIVGVGMFLYFKRKYN